MILFFLLLLLLAIYINWTNPLTNLIVTHVIQSIPYFIQSCSPIMCWAKIKIKIHKDTGRLQRWPYDRFSFLTWLAISRFSTIFYSLIPTFQELAGFYLIFSHRHGWYMQIFWHLKRPNVYEVVKCRWPIKKKKHSDVMHTNISDWFNHSYHIWGGNCSYIVLHFIPINKCHREEWYYL